jgi:hypothetical protein
VLADGVELFVEPCEDGISLHQLHGPRVRVPSGARGRDGNTGYVRWGSGRAGAAQRADHDRESGSLRGTQVPRRHP